MEDFIIHRNNLCNILIPNSIAIVPAAKLQYRNGHTEYPFRQNSSFYYLTGFAEQNAICVLIRGNEQNDHKFILFVEPKIREAELWTGTRVGQEDAKSIYSADEAYTIDKAEEIIPQLLKNKQAIYYPMGEDFELDKKIITWLKLANNKITKKARAQGEKITCVPSSLHNISLLINELRLFKSDQEINKIRKAAEISCQGHLQLMRSCKPGLYEYQLEAVFMGYCMQQGCRAFAYPTIVASGKNSCVLHYIQNNKILEARELVVIDAGAEYQYYASDITRTIPVGGKFNEWQKIIYNLVLQAQLAGLKDIKPGNLFAKVQETVVNTLVTGLVHYGLLSGDIESLIKEKAYNKFYMHNVSHWLGLDVHDVGDYYQSGEHRCFEPGMVLTLEPGLYIAADDSTVEEKWRGIGVRIEDMVLVTEQGYEVLTNDLPKTVEEIEQIMAA